MVKLAFARRHLRTDADDTTLAEKLQAAEQAVRAYTNNDFFRFGDTLPPDVQMGIVHLAAWDLQYRAKAGGVASETLSRHSVSYTPLGGDAVMGYPAGLFSFCKPYRRART